MPNAADVETLLRRTSRRDPVATRVAALGLDPAPQPLDRSAWPLHGLAETDALKTATILARRESMSIMLLQLAI
jgi:hypothetical protein